MLIEGAGLWKLFGKAGRGLSEALVAARDGASREEVMERFGVVLAVVDVEFQVAEGEVFVLMGLSGSGKSTLLRHLNRLVRPTAGSLKIDGRDISALDESEVRALRSRTIGMVFQHDALLPHRSVIENAAFGLELQGVPTRERRRRALEVLERVQLSEWADRRPDELSGGMRQRVGLARALAADPRILLLDEPFSALDPLIRRELQADFLGLIRELGRTAVFVTHDLEEALRVGDRIGVMLDGRLIQVGTPAQIVTAPATEYVQRFVSGVASVGALTAKSVLDLVHSGGQDVERHNGVDALAQPSVSAETPLSELLPAAAASPQPLTVLDDGRPIGEISNQDLLQALAAQPSLREDSA